MMTIRIVVGFLVILLAALPVSAQSRRTSKSKDADWAAQYRGPNRDGLSPDTGLLKTWPENGPPLAWKTSTVGEGYSSVAVSGKLVFTMGDFGGTCKLVALNAANGQTVWSTTVGKAGAPGGYGGPRSTPATDGRAVYALSQHGDLICVAAANGRLVWKKNLKDDFKGRMMSGWGYSESPLLDGNLVVVTPGGNQGTVLALNKANGQKVWQSSQLKDSAAYASLVPVEIARVRQYLLLTDRSVAGINARTGAVVWRADRSGSTAVVPTPVYADGMMFVSSGYGVGCNGFKISVAGRTVKAEEVYSGKQMQNHHGGLILYEGYVYGLGDSGRLKCIELKTGKEVWQDRSVGKGSVAFADGHLVCRSERGKGALALVEATPEGYREKGRFDQPDRSGKNSWAHPVVTGGRMYIRDQEVLLCYDVRAKK